MMNMLVAAIRAKNKPNKAKQIDSGLILSYRPQQTYPQYVLYDSDGEEVECNLSTVKMSYRSSSKQALTEDANPSRGFWLSRTNMEKNLIMLIGALFLVTFGLIIAIGIVAKTSQKTNNGLAINNAKLTPTLHSSAANSITNITTQATQTFNSTTNETEITNDNINITNSNDFNTTINNNTDTQTRVTTIATTIASNNNTNSFTTDSVDANNASRHVVETREANNNFDITYYELVNSSNICNTSTCEEAGKLIKQSLNDSVNPCDDFYEFACGGWMATHTIPKDKSRFGNFDALDEKLQQSVRKELSEPSKESDSVSVVYASDFYKACIDNITLEERGVTPLMEMIKSIGGWPITASASHYDPNSYDWKLAFAKIVAYLDLSFIYSVSVQPDANDTYVHRIYYDAPSFGLGRNQLVNMSLYPDIVNAYKNYILSTALLLGASNDSRTHQDIEDMVNFESQLATLSTPPEERRDAKVWYNRMNFTEFNHLTEGAIDWLSLTNQIYEVVNSSVRISANELVIVEDIPYIKGVSKLLATTSSRTIANYFGWMTASSLGDFTNKKFRDNTFAFSHVTSGVEEETELWKLCASYLENVLEYAVSRKYVDENFTKKDKEEASLMIKDIKESFRELLKVSDWLDDTTKAKSADKLDAIVENVGYPDWMLNNDDLDNYYNLTQKVDPKMMFESMLYLQYAAAFDEFESVRRPVNRTLSWPMPPAIVNAAYEPTQNSITIPAGILKSPFFDSKRPAYMNYGAIGLVIGHEITHGFDDEGSQFDKNGNLVDWWSDAIRKRFDQKSHCFVTEYSGYYDSEAKMNLNGNNTVGENIADNGGLRESYNAYLSYVKREGEPQRLPYISQYSPEQVFFLSYANTWCSLIRPEALKQMIQYNPHSPAKYRVNVPFTNFESFSEVYGCKAGSKMNPQNKCVLW